MGSTIHLVLYQIQRKLLADSNQNIINPISCHQFSLPSNSVLSAEIMQCSIDHRHRPHLANKYKRNADSVVCSSHPQAFPMHTSICINIVLLASPLKLTMLAELMTGEVQVQPPNIITEPGHLHANRFKIDLRYSSCPSRQSWFFLALKQGLLSREKQHKRTQHGQQQTELLLYQAI